MFYISIKYSYQLVMWQGTYYLLIYYISFLKDLILGNVFYMTAAAAAAKSLQSCPTRRDPIEGSLPGSPVPGILQARTLEWVAISFSNRWKWKVQVKLLSCVWLVATPWTAAYQAPPSMGFSRQEYWSRVPFSSPWFWLLFNNLEFNNKCISELVQSLY